MRQKGLRLMRLTGQIGRSATGLISSLLGNALIFLIIARSVGPEDFGRFGQVYVTASLFGLLVDYGYPQRLLRDFSHYQEEFGGIPARTLQLKTLLLAVATALLSGLVWALDFLLYLLPPIWAGLILISYGNFAGACLRAAERHGSDSRNLFLANLGGTVFAAILLLAAVESVLAYSFAFVVIGLLYCSLSWHGFLAHHLVVIRERLSGKAVMNEWRDGISYASDVFVVRAYGFADVLILSLVSTPLSVGIYQAAQKFMQAALPWAQVITNVGLPKLSRRARQHQLNLTDLALLSAVLAVLAALIGTAFYAIFGHLVDELLTREYAAVKQLAPYLALTVFFRLFSVAPSIWIVAAGYQKVRLALNLSNLIIFCVLGSWLGSVSGFVGIAQAVALSGFSSIALYFLSAIYLALLANRPRLEP